MMKLLAAAALLLANSAAQAQYTFEFGGRTIRVDPDRGTVSIPGIYDNSGRRSRHSRTDQGAEKNRKTGADQAKAADPQAPSATPTGVPAEQPQAFPQSSPSSVMNNNAPAETAAAASAPSAPQLQPEAAANAKLGPANAMAAVPPSIPVPTTVAPARAPQSAATTATLRDPNSPIGLWLTEAKESKVRIEQCGTNLCGYAVDSKSNENREQVLINMKAGKDLKWSGRILDPNTGTTYDSTIALKGIDTLRVQGCAFSGMFCGGQIWTRLD